MNTVPTTPQPGESHPHYELITGLRRLAAFLTDHPTLPISDSIGVKVEYYPLGDDSSNVAELRRIGREVDADLEWDKHGSVYVTRDFAQGAIVQYRAIAHRNEYVQEGVLIRDLGAEALAARRAAAAVESVELVVAVDDQAPTVEQLPAAAPVDEGQDDETGTQECEACSGTGLTPSSDGLGFDRDEPCESCHGRGRVLAEPPKCGVCEGDGRDRDEFGIATQGHCPHCLGTGYQQPAVSAW